MENIKGSYASRKWLANYNYASVGLPFVGSLYDFFIYRKICKTCTNEEVYKLNNFISKHGMSHGLAMGINEIKQTLISEAWAKKNQIDELCDEGTLNKWKRELEVKKFQQQAEELQYEAGLNITQLQKRNQLLKGNIYIIPTDVLTSQRVIDSGVYQSTVQYVIYDKIHGCWSAKITAPHVHTQIIRRHTLDDIKAATTNAVRDTCIMSREKKMEADKIRRTRENRSSMQRQQIERESYGQIQRIREVLGQDGNSINSPDIF